MSYFHNPRVPEEAVLALYLFRRRVYSLNITWLCRRMSQGVVGSSKQREHGGNVRRFVLGMRPVSPSPSGAFLPLPFSPSRNVWASPLPSNSHGNYLRRTNSVIAPTPSICNFLAICINLHRVFLNSLANLHQRTLLIILVRNVTQTYIRECFEVVAF